MKEKKTSIKNASSTLKYPTNQKIKEAVEKCKGEINKLNPKKHPFKEIPFPKVNSDLPKVDEKKLKKIWNADQKLQYQRRNDTVVLLGTANSLLVKK